jgi:hypothetical protein
VATGAAALLAIAAPVATAGAAPARPASQAIRPGRTGPAITLASRVDLSGYDAATDAAGTTFIGWIASANAQPSSRTVYLCTLPRGASKCAGGIASTKSLGGDSAAGLTVLATPGGKVTLLWQHTTVKSESG